MSMASFSQKAPLKCDENIGISPSHLHKIYPYHLAIDSNMKFIQIGERLSKLIGSTQDLEGVQIRNLFDIVSPICQWNVDEIETLDTCTFELQLKRNLMLNCRSVSLSLKGGIIVSSSEQFDGKHTVLFLLSLNFSDFAAMQQVGFDMSDISRYTFQDELFTLG